MAKLKNVNSIFEKVFEKDEKNIFDVLINEAEGYSYIDFY